MSEDKDETATAVKDEEVEVKETKTEEKRDEEVEIRLYYYVLTVSVGGGLVQTPVCTNDDPDTLINRLHQSGSKKLIRFPHLPQLDEAIEAPVVAFRAEAIVGFTENMEAFEDDDEDDEQNENADTKSVAPKIPFNVS